MLNYYTGIDEMEKDMGFKIPYVQVDIGVSYNTFRDPKDFNRPPGIYWIQGSGGHYSEWDGQKFNDNTTGARKATNDYYRDWYDSLRYRDETGNFIEHPTYIEQTSYWPRGWTPNRQEAYITGIQWDKSIEEEKQTFLGKAGYKPSLENIYLGLGITGAAQHG